MLFIIDQCPSLRHIWGLDLLMLSPASIAAVQSHIKRNNRHIDVHDGMSGSRLVIYKNEYNSRPSNPNNHFMILLLKYTLNATLDYSSSPTCTIPKGIPFLSERSKHRVEAADNAGDDDGRKLERLLIGEGAFEEILREVSLL